MGNPSTDGFFSDANLTQVIAEANHALGVEADWPWLEASATLTTVSGQQAYTPPVASSTSWLRTVAISRSDTSSGGFYSLVMRSLPEIRELGTETGEPTFYCVSGEQILLAPVPSAVMTYTHDYIKQEKTLAIAADEPFLPAQFQYALVHLATSLAHMRQGDMQRSDFHMKLYQSWLTRMRDNRRRTSQFPRIRVRPGSAF